MYRTIKNTVLTDYQLQKNFTEIEIIINNCPLTHDNDGGEETKALTPNHFFIGQYISGRESFSKTIEADLNTRKRFR